MKKEYWLLDFLESNLIIDAKRTSENTNLEYNKVNRTILKFVDKGILKVNDSSKKNRKYIYEEYIEILEQ